MLIRRTAEGALRELAQGYPVVAVTGPRQSGKTTLVRMVFPEKSYVSLEDLDQRAFAQADPRGFLARYPEGAILDEAQRAPELFSYLQTLVDADRRAGLFILTGSQQFGLLAGITQSLAGRVALLPLLPFSLEELTSADVDPVSLDALLWTGLYPPIHDRKLVAAGAWYGNYVATYLERDVRSLVNVRDLGTFQRFLRMCAARTGQLVNLSGLASDCGVTHNTARAWLSVLEASYLVSLLPPYHRNLGKRLVKTPKLYFLDTGLAAWLLSVQDPSHLGVHPSRGALFETWVVNELLKGRFNRGLRSNLFFWRDQGGHEVDVLVDQGNRLLAVEAKSGATVTKDSFAGVRFWKDLAGDEAGASWVVYGGDEEQQRSEAHVLPWRGIASLARAV
jgi:predicted AAA+ superfamily ATPase